MTALEITTKHNEHTVDGLAYMFTRDAIDYTILFKDDCVEVWKKNNKRSGAISNDCFWNGVNNKGAKMAKFLSDFVRLINAA